MRRRCLCKCHAGGFGDRQRADGVDVRDPIEAAVACRECRGSHAVALSSIDEAETDELPTPPEPASGCYEPPKSYDPTDETE